MVGRLKAKIKSYRDNLIFNMERDGVVIDD